MTSPGADVRVIRFAEAERVDRGHGVSTAYLVTAAGGGTAFVNGITEFEPGAALPFHFHNAEESVHVLSGVATFETTGESMVLHPGDTTLVPTGAIHRFVNAGDARLRLFFTYGAAAPTRTWAESGVTTAIGSPDDRA